MRPIIAPKSTGVDSSSQRRSSVPPADSYRARRAASAAPSEAVPAVTTPLNRRSASVAPSQSSPVHMARRSASATPRPQGRASGPRRSLSTQVEQDEPPPGEEIGHAVPPSRTESVDDLMFSQTSAFPMPSASSGSTAPPAPSTASGPSAASLALAPRTPVDDGSQPEITLESLKERVEKLEEDTYLSTPKKPVGKSRKRKAQKPKDPEENGRNVSLPVHLQRSHH